MAHIRPPSSPAVSRSKDILLIIGILMIAINLRPALATVGPLASEIRDAMGLSSSMLGLLTTLPLLAFGLVSTLTPLVTRRYGAAATLAGAMALLAVGIALRSFPYMAALFGGTILLGIAIAFGNVLLPSIVKQNFSKKYGLMTSMYSSMMGVGAALAAGISVPLAVQLPWGWRGALASWAVLALLALILWLPQLPRLPRGGSTRSYMTAMRHMVRSRLAWNVALFMGLQSFAFYVILAWLPEMLQSRGADPVFSGWMLSLSQTMGVFGSLFIPIWAGRKPSQRHIIWFLVGLELIALLGLIVPSLGPIQLWVALIGFALGGGFGLALFLIVVRAADTDTATELSGMVQSIGYLVAATGPFIVGSLFDLTGNWVHALILLVVVALLKLYTGLGAGKAEVVSY
ncbi:MAG: MFS transporter [Flavobacteriales bacterium]